MKPLILTGWLIPDFIKSEFADLAVDFFFRFGWGQLPSPDELATYLGPGIPDVKPGRHWSDFASGWGQSKNRSDRLWRWNPALINPSCKSERGVP